MATTPLTPIVQAFDLTTSYQTIYTVTSPTNRIGIDSAVFNNYSAANVTYSVRLIQSGTGTSLNDVITDKTIRAYKNDLAPAIIGQALTIGGVIRAKASANSSVSCDITATLIE